MTTSASSWRRRLAAAAALGLACTLSIAATIGPVVPARAAGAPIDPVGSALGRYIVLLNPGAGGLAATAQDLAGAALTRTYATLPAFTATMTAERAARLAADPAVRLVEPDRLIGIAATQSSPDWGLDRIDQRAGVLSGTYTPTDDGSSAHAYVIDTGVRITHRDFGGRASYGYDFVDHDRIASDCNGHGTHVAGTIGGSAYGVAKRVRIVAVRVLGCTGQGYVSDIIDGVDWVTTHAIKPAVANMSLGGDHDPALDQAVRASIASGVTYIVAAGNSSADASTSSPAGLPTAITVGATDADDSRASFSNYGAALDLFAPGVLIRSDWSTGDTATQVESGTSMAAPHVAGAAAMVLDAHPSWSPARVRDYLVSAGTAGVVSDPGTGSPNRLLFTFAPPARPVIRTAAIPAGRVGRAYRVQLALGSNRPGTWRVTAGRWPRGLWLSASGVISGTPRAAGTGSVTVRFTDYVPQAVARTIAIRIKRR